MSFALLQDANLVLYILLQYPPHRHDVIWFICFASLLCLLRGIGDPSSLWRVLVASPLVSLSPRSLTPDRSPALLVLGFPSPFDPPRPRLPWLARWPGPRAPSAVKAAIEMQACVLCTEPAICGYVSLTRHFLRLLPSTHWPFGCIARPAEAFVGGGSEDAVLIGNKRFAFLLFFLLLYTEDLC